MIGQGLFAIAATIIWIYAIFDVVRTDEFLVRNLSKVLWLLLVIFIPVVGPVAWLALGRPESPAPNGGRAPRGPEDTLEYRDLIEEKRRLEKWERELREREKHMREDRGGDSG